MKNYRKFFFPLDDLKRIFVLDIEIKLSRLAIFYITFLSLGCRDIRCSWIYWRDGVYLIYISRHITSGCRDIRCSWIYWRDGVYLTYISRHFTSGCRDIRCVGSTGGMVSISHISLDIFIFRLQRY